MARGFILGQTPGPHLLPKGEMLNQVQCDGEEDSGDPGVFITKERRQKGRGGSLQCSEVV